MKRIVLCFLFPLLLSGTVSVFSSEKIDTGVYLIVDITVRDREIYQRYIEQAAPIVLRHGGQYLVRGGTVISLAGGWKPERLVVIEFPDRASLEACFSSPEYRKILPLREQSTVSRAVIVEGCFLTPENP